MFYRASRFPRNPQGLDAALERLHETGAALLRKSSCRNLMTAVCLAGGSLARHLGCFPDASPRTIFPEQPPPIPQGPPGVCLRGQDALRDYAAIRCAGSAWRLAVRALMGPKRKGRPGGHRTAHFRNCRFATGSIAEFRRGP
jgi:hypothetical protein